MTHVRSTPPDISSSSPPPPCPVPHFAPVRVSGGHRGLRRLLRHRRRAMAAGLAVTAAALVAAGPRDAGPRDAGQVRAQGPPVAAAAPSRAEKPRGAAMVTAPVRIADAQTVRLLHRGDRVDVIASDGSTSRVVAAGARVTEVPGPEEGVAESAAEMGALVVLAVPRATAARLAGAGAGMRLAVTLC
ncbi:hypothetical protein [Streptomyces sp. SYP-A7185]|uniref:hypothetical protein n=1 Tax=Streptomyces sp. SYP-A7185 TaxID=3040076 RepID=UPI0038F70BE8